MQDGSENTYLASNCSIMSSTCTRCRYPRISCFPLAKARAVLTTFLICRPLIFFSPRSRISSALSPPLGIFPFAFWRKATQILRLASGFKSWYLRETWIRDWNASSNTRTRFVVRKRIPRKYLSNSWNFRTVGTSRHSNTYSRWRRKTATMAFLSRNCKDRSSRKTSASSMRTTAPHVAETLRIPPREASTRSAEVPRSPAPTIYRGSDKPCETGHTSLLGILHLLLRSKIGDGS